MPSQNQNSEALSSTEADTPDMHLRASLLGLPCELRDKTWNEVLDLEAATTTQIHLGRNSSYPPSLFHVSKEVRHQAFEYYYSKCHLILPRSEARDWLETFLPGMEKGSKVRIEFRSEWERESEFGLLVGMKALVRALGAEDEIEVTVRVLGLPEGCFMSLRELDEFWTGG